jgi:hypothetical protein
MPADDRYRVDARRIPFTPSWFWEVVDTARDAIVDNSLALSRAVYRSRAEALAAGDEFLRHVVLAAPASPHPAEERRAA